MSQSVVFEMDLPDELVNLKLPPGVDQRLQSLLDKQDSGGQLTAQEDLEAEGLVALAEMLTLLKLRADRLAPPHENGLP